jgi:putative ABC transport system ATP-binding protein
MQRAALARALIVDPDIVLADEPTGNLDSKNGAEVLGLLRALVDDKERPRTVVMVTHDPQAAAMADRRIEIYDGRVRTDSA